jgi:adenosylmethionine-8-amino-7-oxononanoate aminotransferase
MTYSSHPACAAAALANIAILERERIPERARVTGKRFENGLRGMEQYDIVGEVRGSHFMIGVEFVKDKATKELFDDEVEIGKRVAGEAQKRGLIIRPLANMVIFSPSLILTEDQIDEMVSIFAESIKAAMDGLKRDGFL